VSAMHIAIIKQKLPVIEQGILGQATALFEQEVNDLRPENATEAGRDRNYISAHLEQLFQKNNPENWQQFQAEDIPYIPTLIDLMIKNRNLNERAQLTLKRAKQDSAFHEKGLAEKVIAMGIGTHLAGVAEPLGTQIAATIKNQPRYYAIHAAHQWLKGDEDDDEQEDSDDDDDDDDDEKDDDDNQGKNYKVTRSSKRVRTTKDQNKGSKKNKK